MTRSFPNLTYNDQEIEQLEADIQELIEVITVAFLQRWIGPRLRCTLRKKGEHLKAFVECFI